MSLKERIYSILIVSAADNFNSSLKELLSESKYSPVCIAASISEAKREILERSYDFVLINSPLPDDNGTKFSIDVCSRSNAIVLLFIRNEIYYSTYDKVAEYGVFTFSKPVSRQAVFQALDWLASARERLRKLEKKTVSIEEKMEEIRIVNRAKWLLIEVLKMTEADAHRYIEKQAMDRCISKRAVAEDIIRTYS